MRHFLLGAHGTINPIHRDDLTNQGLFDIVDLVKKNQDKEEIKRLFDIASSVNQITDTDNPAARFVLVPSLEEDWVYVCDIVTFEDNTGHPMDIAMKHITNYDTDMYQFGTKDFYIVISKVGHDDVATTLGATGTTLEELFNA